jgi:hypothetical protein
MNPTAYGVRCRRIGRAALALLLCGGLAGCYRTTELAVAAPPRPEMRIVADLSPVTAEQMAPLIGADAVGIEAEVVHWGETEAELALLRVDHRGRSIIWNGERVQFPLDGLRNVQERTLDPRRTALFVGGATTVAMALAVMFVRHLGFGDENGGGGTDPAQ